MQKKFGKMKIKKIKQKNQIKRFVVLDTGAIIDLETWGLHSWGSDAQYGIKVKGNKVYETFWSYGGEWEDDIREETLLGTIVYQSDNHFYIEESGVSPTIIKHDDYAEYGVDLEEIFNLKKSKEDGKNDN